MSTSRIPGEDQPGHVARNLEYGRRLIEMNYDKGYTPIFGETTDAYGRPAPRRLGRGNPILRRQGRQVSRGFASGGKISFRESTARALGKGLQSNPFAHPDMVEAFLA